jgi:hypothetical protein
VLSNDPALNPPAPVVNVVVSHPVSGDSSQIMRGRLDSGADISVIPAEAKLLMFFPP